MSDKLSVSAIKNGTVIDHITSGQSLRIVHLLSVDKSKYTVTLGINLPSKRMGTKDLIKIENRILTEAEANEIEIFAPNATINVIVNFNVIKKITTHLPKSMKRVFTCPNPSCVTQVEPIESYFHIHSQGRHIHLTCHYCEKMYERDQVGVNI